MKNIYWIIFVLTHLTLGCAKDTKYSRVTEGGLKYHRLIGNFVEFDSLHAILPLNSYVIVNENIELERITDNRKCSISKTDTVLQYRFNDKFIMMGHVHYDDFGDRFMGYYIWNKNTFYRVNGDYEQCDIYLFDDEIYFNFIYTYQFKRWYGIYTYNLTDESNLYFYDFIK